ncbi:unnamed protein product [Prunus brigantina]
MAMLSLSNNNCMKNNIAKEMSSNRSLYSNNNGSVSRNNQREPRHCVYYNGDTHNVEFFFFPSKVFLLDTSGMVGSHLSLHHDPMAAVVHIKEGPISSTKLEIDNSPPSTSKARNHQLTTFSP